MYELSADETISTSLPSPVTRPKFVGPERFRHFKVRAITVQNARAAIQRPQSPVSVNNFSRTIK